MTLTKPEQHHLETQLHNIAGWIAETLDDATTKQINRHQGERANTGKRVETPLPFNVTAAEVSRDLEGTLNAWCMEIARHEQWVHMHRPSDMAGRHLLDNMPALLRLDDVRAAADEIGDAHRRALWVIDKPLHRTYQGPCAECGADLWAKPDDDPRCTEGHRVSREVNNHRVEMELESRIFTADELVLIVRDRFGVDIKPYTVHNMTAVKANPLVPRGTTRGRGRTRHGENLYHCGEVFYRLRMRGTIK